MSTMMGSFLAAFDPVTKAAAAAANPQSDTVTYVLYGGDIELMFDKVQHKYFVRRRGEGKFTRAASLTEEFKRVVSSTNITGTLDKPALLPWAVKLAAEEIIAQLEKHSLQGIVTVSMDTLRQIVVEAKREYKNVSQEALDIGHIAHDWLENLQKEAIASRMQIQHLWEAETFALPVVKPDLDGVDEQLQALRTQVADIQTAAVQNCCKEAVDWMIVHNFRPIKVENKVYSINWNVAGTFDTVGLFDSCSDGECCAILNPDGTTHRLAVKDLKVLADWKSSKALYNEYRFQLAAYWEMWLEEHKEALGGRVVVKMPKSVGDKFAAYFLPNEDQPKDFKAFAGLLAPYQRIEEIDEVEWQQKQIAKDKAREDKLMRQAEEDLNKMVMRQLRDAERAKQKADDAAAEVREAEEKAARRLEACPASGRYKGMKPPNCNEGKGCKKCNEIYAVAKAGRALDKAAGEF